MAFDLGAGKPYGEIAGVFAGKGGFVHAGGKNVELQVQAAEEVAPVH